MRKHIGIIAMREWNERVRSRSFLSLALVGPLLVMFVLYILFTATTSDMRPMKVLVSDPIELLENRIQPDSSSLIGYEFINEYIEPEQFTTDVLFAKYDALLVVNEKVLSNNHVFFFQKERFNPGIPARVQRELEKRLEELKAAEFTRLTVQQFRILKHPVHLEVRDARYPDKKGNHKLAAYSGAFFGFIALFFSFLFGMTILRSTNREKSNRIAEVLLAAVKPHELMAGKMLGIGMAALLQFLIWFGLIGLGLFLLRLFVFPDMWNAANFDWAEGAPDSTLFAYNELVRLVYEQLNFPLMIAFLLLIWVLTYLFYGGFFATLGAAQGSESDGQQFLIPLLGMFLLALWSGYYVAENPDSTLRTWFSLIPFTAPMVLLTKLAVGYSPNEYWELFTGLSILLLGAVINIRIAGKVYKNALLTSGYRLRIRKLLRWIFSRS
jgi:ABC-2 type transport system permease protein